MHRLSHIAINNFRACRNVSLPLESFTPLVGQNNTGKSTILEAIKWVLKPSALATSDFADTSQPLAVAVCIEGVTTELLDRIPEKKHRTAIEPFCRDGKAHRVWVWSVGCIEHVTCAEDKGEDAILVQEQQLRAMSAADIEQSMPAFKACFEWIRGI